MSPIRPEDLCSTWTNNVNSQAKCQDLPCGTWVSETTSFASDGTFRKFFRVGQQPSNCDPNSATAHFSTIMLGTYELGNVRNSDYTEISYTPTGFQATMIKSNADLPISTTSSVCNNIATMLNGADGCPCNDTWATGDQRSFTLNSSGVDRRLPNATYCPSGTCSNDFWFPTVTTYGTAHLTNTTIAGPNGTIAYSFKLSLSNVHPDSATGFADYVAQFIYDGTDEGCRRNTGLNEFTCSDGIMNGDETGVDCGGSCSVCPTCTDTVSNGDETGVDCGGSCAACPTCADGAQNGDEAGADCGGSCPACPSDAGSGDANDATALSAGVGVFFSLAALF